MSFAIHSLTDQHVGFLLFSDNMNCQQCIFQGVPVKTIDKESIEGKLIDKLQQLGKFDYELTEGGYQIRHPQHALTAQVEDGQLLISGARFKLIPLQANSNLAP